MQNRHSTCSTVILLSFFLFCYGTIVQAADEKIGAYTIRDIQASIQDNNMLLILKGDSIPAFTQYELFSPTRMVLDIAEAEISENIDVAAIVPKNDFAGLTVTVLRDKVPQITRFEIALADSHTYKVEKIDTNIAVRILPKQIKTADKKEVAAALHDIVVRKNEHQTEILFQANKPIEDYRQDTVTGRSNLADSMYIDINDIDGSELVREKAVGSVVDKIRIATRGSGVRIVFDSAQKDLFTYDIKTVPQGLLVTVIETPSKVSPVKNPTQTVTAENSPQVASKEPVAEVASDPTLDALIDSSEAVINQGISSGDTVPTAAEKLQDSFGFSGYKATRISVDFFKIDLHNVFRLFRQISDINLIVDESVSGSLTLALNDVPWDFALDIILNLKDLKKEERHNTIVIYPNTKEFLWPETGKDNLSFEADVEVIEREALVIQQSTNQTAEIMQAKELLRRASIEEKNDDIEDAAAMYEQAFKLWPNNAKIANKLATLYLVKLGLHAKSAHFAKETLAIDKEDYEAALVGAIASANMDKIPEAMDYFAMSINGTPPMKEALISYAAFSEEKGQPEAALKLLDRYAETYSDTVVTMISRARVYDTMGLTAKATAQYKTLLYSGYQLVPDLKKYIRGRLAMNDNQLSN
jgi:type IV pilus assembly protein PilQ